MAKFTKVEAGTELELTLRVTTVLVWLQLSRIFQLYRGGQFDWWRKQEYPVFVASPLRAQH
jgi:hypothetical protein